MQRGNFVKLIQDSFKQTRSSCNFIFRLCCYHQPAFWCDHITWISSALSKWNRLYLEYSTVSWKIDSIQFSTFWHTTGIQLWVDMAVAIHSDLLTQSKNIPMGQFRANFFLISFTSNYLLLMGLRSLKKLELKFNYFHLPRKQN